MVVTAGCELQSLGDHSRPLAARAVLGLLDASRTRAVSRGSRIASLLRDLFAIPEVPA